jgi:GTP pyrophosphokinase
MPPARLSRAAVDRAGDVLRRHQSGELANPFQLGEAWSVVDAFRREWSDSPHPLTTANMGLRSMAKTVTSTAQVSQRLKRANRIVDKLVRAPRMRLSQMQDVGGCRVVVSTLTELRALQSRVLDRYSVG